MPSLFRFITVLAVLGGLVYGGMVALTIVVEPAEKERTVKIPSNRLNLN